MVYHAYFFSLKKVMLSAAQVAKCPRDLKVLHLETKPWGLFFHSQANHLHLSFRLPKRPKTGGFWVIRPSEKWRWYVSDWKTYEDKKQFAVPYSINLIYTVKCVKERRAVPKKLVNSAMHCCLQGYRVTWLSVALDRWEVYQKRKGKATWRR